MTCYIRRKVHSTEKQEFVVYEASNEKEHEHSEKHHHPGTLAVFREHTQLKDTA